MRLLSGKIPITIHPLFLVLIVAIGWLNSLSVQGTLIWMGVIFFSVLIHELGHALTGLFFGQKVLIEFHGMGGVTQRRGSPLKLWQEFLLVLNGPLAGFLLFLGASQVLSKMAARPADLLTYAVEITVYANLFWTIVNLLPIQPLDGGQLLRILLQAVFGFQGVKIAFFISMVLSAGFGLFFLQYGAMLIGMLFFMFTFEGYRNWQGSRAISKQDQSLELQLCMKKAEREMRQGNDSEALKLFMEVRGVAKEGILYIASTECAAKIFSDRQEFLEAYRLLDPVKKRLSVEGLRLLQRVAYRTANWEETIAVGNVSFQSFPDHETALLNALSHAVLGQSEPAIGWLQTAINEGLPNLFEVLQRKEFDSIRHSEPFQRLA